MDLQTLKWKIISHDWSAQYSRALCERIEIVKELIEVPFPQLAKLLNENLKPEEAALVLELCRGFIERKQK